MSFSTTTYANDNLWFQDGPPNTLVRADLNGDGREDFVSQNTASWSSGCGFTAPSFAVTLSSGDGAYAAPVCYAVPAGFAINFATGDFYGTGNLDLAVSDDQGDLYIYRNAGNGALTLASTVTLAGEANGLVAADVNHDGHIDLAYDVGNNNTGGGGSLYVLFGNGDGTFTAGPITSFTMANEPAGSLAVGDFDGDGNRDILVIGVTLYDAEVLYGDNAGHFTAGPILGSSLAGATSAVLTWYQAFDIDSDGTMDLIGAPFTYAFCGSGCLPTVTENNYLDLERGRSNRTLKSEKVPLKSCSASAAPPQIADFDGDGIADLIIAEDSDCKGDGPYTLNFMKGNGNRTFGPEQVIYSTSDFISIWHVMRASRSGKPDLTVYQFQDVNNTITNPEELVLVNKTSRGGR